MKHFLLLTVLFTHQVMASSETLHECTLSKLLDDNILEESLSKHEYPDLTVDREDGKISISIGANTFDSTEYKIEEQIHIEVVGAFAYKIKAKVKDYQSYSISSNGREATAYVLGAKKPFAKFKCLN
jgi:hypothetical protein